MYDSEQDLALRRWLAAGAPPIEKLIDLCEELGKRLQSAGLSVEQVALYTTTIHPEMPGTYVYWTEASGVRSYSFTPEQLRSQIWMGCAAQCCSERGRLVVHSFGQLREFDERPEVRMLKRHGYKQFIYTPLHSKFTLVNSVAGYGTTDDAGFSDNEIDAIRLIQAPLARVVEGLVLHESTIQILSTYVGRDAGSRVLRGNILRGDSEAIPSVVLFADLCGFTALSNTQPAIKIITVLNTFFDAAGAAISNHGGEILKFMGDGLLAVFPTPDDVSAQLSAAMNAISAIKEMRSSLEERSQRSICFRAALDVGDIYYGNVGSCSRLDFTAIGPTVNRAARLLSVAETLGAGVVCSDALHRLLPNRSILLSEETFKGFDSPQNVYSVDI